MLKTIGILEDDEDLIFAFEHWFRRTPDYSIHCFIHPDELFNHLGNSHPDILLLDYKLSSSINGLEVAKRSRELYSFKGKIILMSAATLNNLDLESGFIDGFIEKPFNFQELTNQLNE